MRKSLARQVFRLRLCTLARTAYNDGFAKMPLRASIFASWYNDKKNYEQEAKQCPTFVIISIPYPRRH